MVRILAGVFAAIVLGSSVFAQSQSFTVTFRISGLDATEARLVLLGERTEDKRTVTMPIVDGRFTYAGSATGLSHVRADLGNGRFVEFFVFPGARVDVDGTVDGLVLDAYPAGDRANDDLTILNRELAPHARQFEEFEMKAARQANEARATALRQAARPVAAEMTKIRTAFLRAHPSSPAAVWLLSDMLSRREIGIGDAAKAFKNLRDVREASEPYYGAVERRLAGIENAQVGKPVPAVRATLTYDGAPFDLAAHRGRYVVIDFWGTWCGPCMSEIPRLREYRARYAEKVQFISIAERSPEADWRATIEKAPLDWPQLRNGIGDEDFVVAFNVSAYPTKFLIDPSGKIIARFVGNGNPFYKKLESLFGR